MIGKGHYIRVVQSKVRIKDHMEDVNIILSNPEAYSPSMRMPAVPNITYRHIYVSLVSS